jgi:RNA-splicing ligase RtcB
VLLDDNFNPVKREAATMEKVINLRTGQVRFDAINENDKPKKSKQKKKIDIIVGSMSARG